MQSEFSTSYIYDPTVFAINALPPHSDHAFTQADGSARFSLSLCGEWRCKISDSPDEVDLSYADGSRMAQMRPIDVPGNIEMQGFFPPQYTNFAYPWDGCEAIKPPKLPKRGNYTVLYVRKFDVPEAALKTAVRLCFDGVLSGVAAFVNGRFAGYAEDSCTPDEFDITEFLRPGENTLAALVPRFTTGSWLEDQDIWRLCGIFRPVRVYSVPQLHINDMALDATVTPSLDAGMLCVRIAVQGGTSGAHAKASLLHEGEVIATADFSGFAPDGTAKAVIAVNSPQLWSAEAPNLYDVEVTLVDAAGALRETAAARVGFRRFEMQNGVMHLNGKRIIFNGVNRHEFHPERGRAITEDDIRFDLLTLKRNNFNAIRTSHYPNQTRFYELCDELGFYVIDETNLETHGTWAKMLDTGKMPKSFLPDDHTEWREAVLARAQAMAARDKNHPCILLWSCGNESAGGKTLFDMAEYFRSLGDGRLVHYEGVFVDGRFPDTTDVESRMYAKPNEIEDYLKAKPKKPFISCEYCHAMGNSFGNADEYYDLQDKYPQYQGGFIWDYLDLGIKKREPDGREYYASGLDFPTHSNNGDFCGDGLMLSDRTETAKMREARFLNAPLVITCRRDGIEVRNRQLFLGTDAYSFAWELLYDGEVTESGMFDLSVPAGETGFFAMTQGLTSDSREAVLFCRAVQKHDTAWACAGREVAYGETILREAEYKKPSGGKLIPTVGDFSAGGAMAHSTALFEGVYGELTSLAADGKERLLSGIRPDFWRAPTDNDIASGNTMRWAQWKVNSLYKERKAVKFDLIKFGINIKYGLPLFDKGCDITYTFYKNDTVRAVLSLPPFKGDLPCFGLTFDMPPEYHIVEFYGNSMTDSYIDRRNSRKLRKCCFNAQNALVPYLNPQECGNLTDVRTIAILDANGHGLRIRSDGEFQASVLPYSSHELEAARNISCLPPVTKTVVSLRKAMCGVGGDDTWGAPVHDKYLVRGEHGLTFTVYIEII